MLLGFLALEKLIPTAIRRSPMVQVMGFNFRPGPVLPISAAPGHLERTNEQLFTVPTEERVL